MQYLLRAPSLHTNWSGLHLPAAVLVPSWFDALEAAGMSSDHLLIFRMIELAITVRFLLWLVHDADRG
jgi:hypothetical protein